MNRTSYTIPFRFGAAFILFSSLLVSAVAQDAARPAPQSAQQSTPDDDSPAPAFDTHHATAAQNTDQAWSMLTTSLGDLKHLQNRIQAIAALGTMIGNPRAEKSIAAALNDPNLDIRTAAVLAAGQLKSRSLATSLRAKLDDKEPQVAFAAAITLSKMGDRSGEDILSAVVDGERKASASLMNGTMHTMNKDFHDPAALAKMGALQGASMLLGPFGFGITAYEYMRKNGGESARVTAIDELAKLRTEPIHKELIAALGDKDPGVRAAAAKALGSYRDKTTATALLNLFADPKLPVRLTAAAAYIRNTGPATTPQTETIGKIEKKQ
jgi:HEAT repeat protein